VLLLKLLQSTLNFHTIRGLHPAPSAWFAKAAGRTSRVSARMVCYEVTHGRPPPFNMGKPSRFAGPEKITAEASPCSWIHCRECDERGKAVASGTQPCIQGLGLPTEACRYIQRLICEGGMLK
jgi:hypothetical protein